MPESRDGCGGRLLAEFPSGITGQTGLDPGVCEGRRKDEDEEFERLLGWQLQGLFGECRLVIAVDMMWERLVFDWESQHTESSCICRFIQAIYLSYGNLGACHD